MPRTPKLIQVDLRRAHAHDHPDVKTSKTYLAKIDGSYYLGEFSREHYGLSFDDDWGTSGHQFDAPGYNGSKWEGLWELR